jgi:nucleoside-diphosphate-sugar epimerase
MDVAIAGGHGQIARRLASLLAARGDSVRGLIRNPNHAAAVHASGAEPVPCDLEHAGVTAIAEAIEGTDAVVFAAGAGPGSGTARKLTMDRDGAIKLLDAARAVGTRRYVIISSIGAENPPQGDDPFSVYLQAKAAADAAVAASDRDWTIVRPGRLTDEPGAGRVRLQIDPFRGEVARDDVAAVLAAVLPEPRANGVTLYVNGGDDPVPQALEAVL